MPLVNAGLDISSVDQWHPRRGNSAEWCTHSGETLTLSWDALSRLTAVASSTAGTTTYAYDPLDRLETITAGSTTTSFAYVGLTNALARTSAVTSGSGGGTIVTSHATDLDGTELYEYTGSSPIDATYLHRNDHDDVTWTSSESGARSGNAAYDPFGNLTTSATGLPSFRWQSSYQDDTTGLYYVVARWYSPTLGRFLSDDPMDQDTTDPQSRDPYAYANGDPIDATDTSGESCATTGATSVGCQPCDNTSCSLNTLLVGHIHEPSGWKRICGPGSLRVTLAFAASYSTIEFYSKNPSATAYGHGIKEAPVTWKSSGSDGYGTAFMMYLATLVMGSANAPGATPVSVQGLTAAKKSPESILTILNRISRSDMSFQFVNTSRYSVATGKSQLDTAIMNSIKHGIPDMIATQMYLLPSQANFSGTTSQHWISVVAYDSSYYYYIDTCWAAMACGAPGPSSPSLMDPYDKYGIPQMGVDIALLGGKYNVHKTAFDATNKNQADRTSLAYRAKYPGTWRISKADLWRAVDFDRNSLGWMIFKGTGYVQGQGD